MRCGTAKVEYSTYTLAHDFIGALGNNRTKPSKPGALKQTQVKLETCGGSQQDLFFLFITCT
jgi:hypothetical protein